MSPVSLRNNMGTAETKELRLSCSDCKLIFSSQREFQLHVNELHGELERCLKVGCECSGSIPADQLEAGKERAENVVSGSNDEKIVVSSAESLKGNVVADNESGKVNNSSQTSSNTSESQPSTAPLAKVPLDLRNDQGQQEYTEEQIRVRAYTPLPPGAPGPRSLEGTQSGEGFERRDCR